MFYIHNSIDIYLHVRAEFAVANKQRAARRAA